MTTPSQKTRRPGLLRSSSSFVNGYPHAVEPAPPVTAPPAINGENSLSASVAVLELADGSAFKGISFGAEGKSVSGECVFQTGEHGFLV